MPYDMILKCSKKATLVAKKIFGDIVSNVYYADFATVGMEEYITASLKEQDAVVKDSDNHLDQDGKIIVVEFTNGKKVIFSNSEWGSMEAFDTDKVLYI